MLAMEYFDLLLSGGSFLDVDFLILIKEDVLSWQSLRTLLQAKRPGLTSERPGKAYQISLR